MSSFWTVALNKFHYKRYYILNILYTVLCYILYFTFGSFRDQISKYLSICLKVYNTSGFCWYCLFTIYWTKTTSTPLRRGVFSPFFLFSIIFLCCQIVSGVFNSRLYPSFILNTNLSLMTLMEIRIWRLVGNVSCFLGCIWYNLEYLTLNKNDQAIQFYHSTLELLFLVYYFGAVVYIFPGEINRQVLRRNMFIRTSPI